MTEAASTFTLPRPAARAIHLFTPRGEEAWVPGWSPRYAWPPDGETRAEMLFTTRDDEGVKTWTCLAWEPEAGHARYLKIHPGVTAAVVDVRCTPVGPARTHVAVHYRLHALGPTGEAVLASFDRAGFEAGLATWPDLIAAADC